MIGTRTMRRKGERAMDRDDGKTRKRRNMVYNCTVVVK